MGVVDIGSNSVRLVVYEGAVRSPTPIFNEKVLCGLGRQVGSTGKLGEESVERALEALSRFRAIARILGVKNICAIATAACRDASDGPEFIARGEQALRHPHPGPVRPARGRARRQRHHDGLSLARRHRRRPRRRQPGADRRRGRGPAPGPRRCRSAACGCSMPPATGSSAPSTSPTSRSRACPGSTAGATAPSTRSAAPGAPSPACTWSRPDYPLHVMHGYTMPTDGGDRLLRGDPQDQEAVRPAGHRGAVQAAARGAALRRPGAGAAPEAARAERGRLLGVRHPRGPGLQPDVGDRAPQGPAAVASAPSTRGLRSRSAEHAVELCNWTDALFEPPGPKETRRGAAPAPCRLPALRHQLARAPRLPRRAEPDPDRACGARRHRPSRPRVPGARHLLPPHRRRRGRGRGQAVRAPEGDRVQEALQARPHRRRGDPRRPHAVDRPARHHRRDAAHLRARQAGADRAQGLCRPRRRAPAPPLRRAGRAAGARAGDPRRQIRFGRLRGEVPRLGARAPRSC